MDKKLSHYENRDQETNALVSRVFPYEFDMSEGDVGATAFCEITVTAESAPVFEDAEAIADAASIVAKAELVG